jgi:hypothetical protein
MTGEGAPTPAEEIDKRRQEMSKQDKFNPRMGQAARRDLYASEA